MGNTISKQPTIVVTGNTTDISLVDIWLRGVLLSVYGSQWEIFYKQAKAMPTFKAWEGLLVAES